MMPTGRELKTGADLVAAIQERARVSGVRPSEVAAALAQYPQQWLKQTAAARRPKPETIERVRALLEGRPVPPPIGVNRAPDARLTVAEQIVEEVRVAGERRAAARSIQTVSPHTVIELARPAPPIAATTPTDRRPFALSREPCPRCAVRGDLGCAHQRPFDPEAL